MFGRLDKWHKTAVGYSVFGLIELAIAYALASLAIDRGNLIYYLLTLVFLAGGLQNLFKLLSRLINYGHNKTRRTGTN